LNHEDLDRFGPLKRAGIGAVDIHHQEGCADDREEKCGDPSNKARFQLSAPW
jgi:hypothetical protein